MWKWIAKVVLALRGYRVEECVSQYLAEITPQKSAGNRRAEILIRYQRRVERARTLGRPLPSPPRWKGLSGTQYQDRLSLKFFVSSLPPGLRMRHLNLLHLQRHRRLLLEPEDGKRAPIKPQSVARREHVIRAFLNFAVAMKYLSVSPAAELRPLKAANERLRRGLRNPEREKLLRSAPRWLRDMLDFGFETAARRAQICFLIFGCIDWDRRQVIFSSHSRFNPKDRKKTVVPLNDRIFARLQFLHRRALAQGRGGPEDYVFLGPNGEFVRPDRLTKATTELIRRVLGTNAGIGNSVHVCRHTAAQTWRHERGGSSRDVQKLMGHANASTTEGYIGENPAQLRRVVNGKRR